MFATSSGLPEPPRITRSALHPGASTINIFNESWSDGSLLDNTESLCADGQPLPRRAAGLSHDSVLHNPSRDSVLHVCPDCGKRFQSRKDVKRHHLIHTGEKPFLCPHCPYKGRQMGALKSHFLNKHSNKN